MLTGKTRYRSSMFGKLVLQVEEEYLDFHPLGTDTLLRWRDADFEDFQELEAAKVRNKKGAHDENL